MGHPKDTSYKTSLVMNDTLKLLEQAGLMYSIKNSKLEYQKVSHAFCTAFGLDGEPHSDFDLFIPEIAYEVGHEDSLALTSQVSSESNRVLITKDERRYVMSVTRNIIQQEDSFLLVTFYKDVTQASQDKQFESYKGVLTEPEVFDKMLNRFSNLIFNTNDRREIFEGVASLALDLLDLDDFTIFILDQKNQVLHQVFELNSSSSSRYFEKGEHLSISINDGLTGRAARHKKSVMIDDVALDTSYISGYSNTRSELAVPIIYKNKVLGVLDSESNQYARYNDRILKTIEGIASLLAIKLNELNNYRKLSVSNDKLTSLIHSNPYPMAVLDNDCNYLFISETWYSQFVNNGRDVIGLNHFDVNPNLPIRWKKMILDAQQGESVVLHKESYRRKNGQVVFFSAKINPWYQGEEIGGVVLVAEDVTQYVQNEVKLSQSQKELDNAHKYGKLFKWEANLETGEFSWNAGSFSIPSFPARESLGLDSVFDLIDSSYHADFNQAIETAIAEKGSFSIIHPFTLDGVKYWLHNRGKVVINEDDASVQKIQGTAQDITNQVDAENAFRQQNIELKKINQELDQFVYKTAHDLRAPLTNLTGLISIMKNETNPELLKSYFELQEKSVEKLDAFIQQITTHTKNSRLETKIDSVDMHKLVDSILAEYLYAPQSDRILKTVEIDKNVEYNTDMERLKIILSNLVSNAIKYSDMKKERPSLRIKIGSVANKIHIQVWDNGEGIAEERQPKVFDMFYRASKKADGSGIGLYIVKETINKLYGQIMLSSEIGNYTQFDVFLPNSQA